MHVSLLRNSFAASTMLMSRTAEMIDTFLLPDPVPVLCSDTTRSCGADPCVKGAIRRARSRLEVRFVAWAGGLLTSTRHHRTVCERFGPGKIPPHCPTSTGSARKWTMDLSSRRPCAGRLATSSAHRRSSHYKNPAEPSPSPHLLTTTLTLSQSGTAAPSLTRLYQRVSPSNPFVNMDPVSE